MKLKKTVSVGNGSRLRPVQESSMSTLCVTSLPDFKTWFYVNIQARIHNITRDGSGQMTSRTSLGRQCRINTYRVTCVFVSECKFGSVCLNLAGHVVTWMRYTIDSQYIYCPLYRSWSVCVCSASVELCKWVHNSKRSNCRRYKTEVHKIYSGITGFRGEQPDLGGLWSYRNGEIVLIYVCWWREREREIRKLLLHGCVRISSYSCLQQTWQVVEYLLHSCAFRCV